MTTAKLQPADPTPEVLTAALVENRRNWNNPARMPTRFGVGLMLLFLTLFSVGFWILTACGTPPAAILFLTLLFTVVGWGQILWPPQPRLISTLAGGMFVPLWLLAYMAYDYNAGQRRWSFLLEALPLTFCTAPVGALCGYLAGALIAGIFLRAGVAVTTAPAAPPAAEIATTDPLPAADPRPRQPA